MIKFLKGVNCLVNVNQIDFLIIQPTELRTPLSNNRKYQIECYQIGRPCSIPIDLFDNLDSAMTKLNVIQLWLEE